jgi:hypothetical protein
MTRYGTFLKAAWLAAVCVVLVLSSGAALAQGSANPGKTDVVRISPVEAHKQVQAKQSLLVCAYGDEATCRDIMLEGAITLKEFEGKLQGLKKSQGIIFYCA